MEAKALLAWGFEIKRHDARVEVALEALSDKSWEEFWAEAKGITKDGNDSYYRDVARLIDNTCMFLDHGEEHGPVVVYVTASATKADWEGVVGVNFGELFEAHHATEWYRLLTEFCETLGLPKPDKPDWFLTAFYW